MSDEVITGETVETPEQEAPPAPPTDSLESIVDTMRATQERMLERGDITPDEAIPTGEHHEERHDLQQQGDGEHEGQEGSDVLSEGQEERQGLLDKWMPVLRQATGQDEVAPEVGQQLVDNLMTSWTGLQTKPVDTTLAIIDQYIPKEQQAQLITALAHRAGVDPLDIDVDSYAQSQPNPEFTQLQQQNQALQAQMVTLQVEQMKASGNYPALSNPSFAQQMAAVYGKYPDLDLPQAYNFVAAQNPDQLQQAAASVEETPPKPTTRRLARRGDILPKGKPNGAIMNDVPRNPVEHLRMKRSELM